MPSLAMLSGPNASQMPLTCSGRYDSLNLLKELRPKFHTQDALDMRERITDTPAQILL